MSMSTQINPADYDEDSGNVWDHARREYLAGVVGASKETISRMLSKLKEARLIAISGSRITIPDVEKLRRIRV